MSADKKSSGFSVGVIIGVILVGVFSFSAFLVLSAFEPELTSGRDGRAHALSTSAVGFAGAVQLARATGENVRVGRTVGAADRRTSLVILTPERDVTWSDITDVAGQTTLLILPKWGVGPDPTHPGWVSRGDVYPPQALAGLLHDVAPDIQIVQAHGVSTPPLFADGEAFSEAGNITSLQTMSGASIIPAVTDDKGGVILGRVARSGRTTDVYILSEPDLLNTQGIADINNARSGMAVLSYLRQADEPIVFDVTLNGLGTARSALRLAFQPPFLGATLAFVIATGLLAWRAALRFGPSAHVRRAIALGKAALADNSAALIRLAHREHQLGPGYARLTGSVVAEAAGFGRKDEDDAVALLDRLSEAQETASPFSQLSAEAAAAKTPSQMLEAARKLHAWKEETVRATR